MEKELVNHPLKPFVSSKLKAMYLKKETTNSPSKAASAKNVIKVFLYPPTKNATTRLNQKAHQNARVSNSATSVSHA
ncbi:hypothetical protein SDJN02_12527, partial [Cucurbita argyrosperma subsp. argyrosperma]